MAKVIIYLKDCELTALNDLAQREYRALKAQAALIIRNELERLGLIPEEQPTHHTGDPKRSNSDTSAVLSDSQGEARVVGD
jgi:hypothetical protein